MRKFFNWQINLSLALIALSAIVYFIHYLIFKDAHHIFIYLIGDIGFVFFEVLLVTVIIHRLLNEREKLSMLNKLNMVIGAFFSEVGTHLLKTFAEFDISSVEITKEFVVNKEWSGRDFAQARRLFKNYKCQIDVRKGDIEALKGFLTGRRNFLLRLLENPNLLEHKTFTDLLWAVFHLTEELVHRKDLRALPEADFEHLAGDIKRAYVLLILEWLSYMNHLKREYPYLYSLAVRTNPFDQKAQIELT